MSKILDVSKDLLFRGLHTIKTTLVALMMIVSGLNIWFILEKLDPTYYLIMMVLLSNAAIFLLSFIQICRKIRLETKKEIDVLVEVLKQFDLSLLWWIGEYISVLGLFIYSGVSLWYLTGDAMVSVIPSYLVMLLFCIGGPILILLWTTLTLTAATQKPKEE
jgi:hypothetical protein